MIMIAVRFYNLINYKIMISGFRIYYFPAGVFRSTLRYAKIWLSYTHSFRPDG